MAKAPQQPAPQQPTMEEVLRRMLATPPDPHVKKQAKKQAKRAKK
jgi:hypothetical protein